MKRIASLCLLTFFCLGAGMLLAAAQTSTTQAQTSTNPDQPLGQWAREQKKNKKPAARSYDNDTIPRHDTLTMVDKSAHDNDAQNGTAQNSSAEPAAEGGNETQSMGRHAKVEQAPHVTPGESEEDRQKVYDKWQDKLSEQQEKLDLATRELDVAQREYKLRAADLYGDAGNRLRNSTDWDKKDTEYKKQIEEKQKQLDDAKTAMESMQDEARKAGVPNSVTEKAATEKPQQ